MAITYTQIFQFVFAVQDRASLIQSGWKDELYKYITGIVQNDKHKLIAINGMPNHLHVFVGYKPHQLIPDLLQDIKGSSSGWINNKKLVNGKFRCQEGYGAFSYSHSHMTFFDDSDLEIYIDNFTHIVRDSSKTIYENFIPLDSSVENRLARDCESREQVEFYFKLPCRFEINTSTGRYRPDWAVVIKGEKKIYFVAETKSAGEELRESEKLKIACGTAHFKDFDDVDYKRVLSVTGLKN